MADINPFQAPTASIERAEDPDPNPSRPSKYVLRGLILGTVSGLILGVISGAALYFIALLSTEANLRYDRVKLAIGVCVAASTVTGGLLGAGSFGLIGLYYRRRLRQENPRAPE